MQTEQITRYYKSIIEQCQKILADHINPSVWVSKKRTISRLLGVLDDKELVRTMREGEQREKMGGISELFTITIDSLKDLTISRLKAENAILKNSQKTEINLKASLPDAIDVLIEHLRKDKTPGSYYYGWQSNIAVAMHDELKDFIKTTDVPMFAFLDKAIWTLSNKAAQRFLDSFTHKPSFAPGGQVKSMDSGMKCGPRESAVNTGEPIIGREEKVQTYLEKFHEIYKGAFSGQMGFQIQTLVKTIEDQFIEPLQSIINDQDRKLTIASNSAWIAQDAEFEFNPNWRIDVKRILLKSGGNSVDAYRDLVRYIENNFDAIGEIRIIQDQLQKTQKDLDEAKQQLSGKDWVQLLRKAEDERDAAKKELLNIRECEKPILEETLKLKKQLDEAKALLNTARDLTDSPTLTSRINNFLNVKKYNDE